MSLSRPHTGRQENASRRSHRGQNSIPAGKQLSCWFTALVFTHSCFSRLLNQPYGQRANRTLDLDSEILPLFTFNASLGGLKHLQFVHAAGGRNLALKLRGLCSDVKSQNRQYPHRSRLPASGTGSGPSCFLPRFHFHTTRALKTDKQGQIHPESPEALSLGASLRPRHAPCRSGTFRVLQQFITTGNPAFPA